MDALQRVFDGGLTQPRAASRLCSLSQGPRSVTEYAIEFRTLAAETGWEGEALVSTFYQGLRESLKDEMVNRDWGEDLDDIITLATALDKRMRERRRECREFRSLPPTRVQGSPLPLMPPHRAGSPVDHNGGGAYAARSFSAKPRGETTPDLTGPLHVLWRPGSPVH